MHFSVPLAALLASGGIYGLVLGAIALRNPSKLNAAHSNLQEPIEWWAVVCISGFGMIGSAVALAAGFGSAPWTPFLIATPIVGALCAAFFKMLEITPTPIFAMLVNTRLFGSRRRRRRFIDDAKLMWEESSIDGNVLEHQTEKRQRDRRYSARKGAVSLATIITAVNLVWVGKLLVSLDASLLLLLPLLFLFVGLVIVLTRAGRSVASRAKDINWRQPF